MGVDADKTYAQNFKRFQSATEDQINSADWLVASSINATELLSLENVNKQIFTTLEFFLVAIQMRICTLDQNQVFEFYYMNKKKEQI